MSKVNELKDKFPGAPKELYYLKAGLEDVIMPAISQGGYFTALMEARGHLMRLETIKKEIELKPCGGNLISSVRIMIDILSKISEDDESDEDEDKITKDRGKEQEDAHKEKIGPCLERIRAFLAQTLMPYRKVPETT